MNTLGSGEYLASFVSRVNETYSCLIYWNPIYNFKTVYDQTIAGKGQWEVSYSCVTSIPEKDYTWFIVAGVVFGVLVIVGGIFGLKYMKKKKSQNEGETTDKTALLQNA